MGPTFIQTTLFLVFAINHSSKLEYLPIPNKNNFVIDLPISQNGFGVCFVIQNLEKNQIQMVNQLKICFIFVCFVIQHLKGSLRSQIDIIHKVKMILVFILVFKI